MRFCCKVLLFNYKNLEEFFWNNICVEWISKPTPTSLFLWKSKNQRGPKLYTGWSRSQTIPGHVTEFVLTGNASRVFTFAVGNWKFLTTSTSSKQNSNSKCKFELCSLYNLEIIKRAIIEWLHQYHLIFAGNTQNFPLPTAKTNTRNVLPTCQDKFGHVIPNRSRSRCGSRYNLAIKELKWNQF